MSSIVRLSPSATVIKGSERERNAIYAPYESVSVIEARGTWRVLDMLPTNVAVAMVKFRMTLKER